MCKQALAVMRVTRGCKEARKREMGEARRESQDMRGVVVPVRQSCFVTGYCGEQ